MSLGYLKRLGLAGTAQTADVAPAINALEHFLAFAPTARQFPAEAMATYQQAWAILVAYTGCGCGDFPPVAGASKDEAMKRVAELVQNARALATQPQTSPGVIETTSAPSVSNGQAPQVAISPDAPADSTFLKQPAATLASAIPSWVWWVVAAGVGYWALSGDSTAAPVSGLSGAYEVDAKVWQVEEIASQLRQAGYDAEASSRVIDTSASLATVRKLAAEHVPGAKVYAA